MDLSNCKASRKADREIIAAVMLRDRIADLGTTIR